MSHVGHSAQSFRPSCQRPGSAVQPNTDRTIDLSSVSSNFAGAPRVPMQSVHCPNTLYFILHNFDDDLPFRPLPPYWLQHHHRSTFLLNSCHCARIWHEDILATCDLSLIFYLFFFHGAHMCGWILLGLVRSYLSFQCPAELQIHSPAHSP